MPRKLVLAAIVFATALFMGALAPVFPGISIEAAQAKDFYTRKRANGQWVTGKFYYRDRKSAYDVAGEQDEPPVPPIRPVATAASETMVSDAKTAAVPEKADFYRAAAAAPETPVSYMDRLRVALEARARQMQPPVPVIPETIVIDSVSGIKTTFFSDGSIREELLEPTKTGSVIPAF
ncbi:hypothetical protein [Microvirga massiliensis]|uniref:hypothetical protein n=1 Tax=Microvirga massiliensis TaxID=1033741 RepID=UPI00062BD18F|nr:hypothetical protein [Microvirga massiliensis]